MHFVIPVVKSIVYVDLTLSMSYVVFLCILYYLKVVIGREREIVCLSISFVLRYGLAKGHTVAILAQE